MAKFTRIKVINLMISMLIIAVLMFAVRTYQLYKYYAKCVAEYTLLLEGSERDYKSVAKSLANCVSTIENMERLPAEIKASEDYKTDLKILKGRKAALFEKIEFCYLQMQRDKQMKNKARSLMRKPWMYRRKQRGRSRNCDESLRRRGAIVGSADDAEERGQEPLLR
jgi:hypothetical protein